MYFGMGYEWRRIGPEVRIRSKRPRGNPRERYIVNKIMDRRLVLNKVKHKRPNLFTQDIKLSCLLPKVVYGYYM